MDEGSGRLFRPVPRFAGLPAGGFRAFDLPHREARRVAIVSAFHPALGALGEDLQGALVAPSRPLLHAHLPRLDWPPGYQPFCTWLALSREAHGYQSTAQLNVGVHRDHVAVRLGWDTASPAFGRFEFRCRHAGLGEAMAALAVRHVLTLRVYAAAPWPEGSRLVFETVRDWEEGFEEVRRRGVWLELGVRHDLPGALARVTSPALGEEARHVFSALLPLYDRILGSA